MDRQKRTTTNKNNRVIMEVIIIIILIAYLYYPISLLDEKDDIIDRLNKENSKLKELLEVQDKLLN